jgi:hypothetical protein
MRNRVVIQRFMVPIADCTVVAEPFRFEPEPVRISAYPSLSIPPQFVVRAVRAAFKLAKQQVGEDLVVFNWRSQVRHSGSDFAGLFRR